MFRFTPEEVRLEHWTERLFVADDATARATKTALEAHFLAEWNDDIEGTMETMDPEAPFQRIPALGIEVRGPEAVRGYYLQRFSSWPGPAMDRFDRATVVPDLVIVEGRLRASGDAAVAALSGPAVIVVEFRDGLILGETIHAAPAPR
ncbi:nuclear transport factor 2 family protein [Hoeflea sp.]|uniref:nuclear transport factor 2 family protein n=1 Tax=Hoeflea sp. TaxID=1940281 RepID=UPI0019B670F9|nr:nuclear transport factor 2 family protein [Hoeflea sp.]MBC7285679.1 nuclear transport factor 2 family protein [Hoeflea sp.]